MQQHAAVQKLSRPCAVQANSSMTICINGQQYKGQDDEALSCFVQHGPDTPRIIGSVFVAKPTRAGSAAQGGPHALSSLGQCDFAVKAQIGRQLRRSLDVIAGDHAKSPSRLR
jgi:hypothetical protein